MISSNFNTQSSAGHSTRPSPLSSYWITRLIVGDWFCGLLIIMSISEKEFKEEVGCVVHEGFLEKESRILKTWRR